MLQVACQNGAWGLSSSSGGCVVVVVIVPMAARTFGTFISPHGDVVASCRVMGLRAAWRRWSEVQRRAKAPGERSGPGARAAGPSVLCRPLSQVPAGGPRRPRPVGSDDEPGAKSRRLAGLCRRACLGQVAIEGDAPTPPQRTCRRCSLRLGAQPWSSWSGRMAGAVLAPIPVVLGGSASSVVVGGRLLLMAVLQRPPLYPQSKSAARAGGGRGALATAEGAHIGARSGGGVGGRGGGAFVGRWQARGSARLEGRGGAQAGSPPSACSSRRPCCSTGAP